MEQKEFERWIRQIRPQLHHEALRLLFDGNEAEDAIQDAVLKLWTMRQTLGQYRSPEALAVVMVRRIALTLKRTATVPLAGCQKEDIASGTTPESYLIDREEEAKVVRPMITLPDMQQAVLRMKHIDGLETAEIAHITGCTEEAVRQNLSRARKE